MASNPNESGPYDIVHATKWSKGGRGELKSRLVVIRFKDINKSTRFAVRWQHGKGGDNAATHGGSSFNSRESAQEALWRLYLNHNDFYRQGNLSHLPGMAK